MNNSVVIVCFLFATVSVRAADSSIEGKIKAIRQRYAEVEGELKQCRQVKRDLPDESAEGGELTGYFKGPSLRKMAAKFYGETGQALEEYYFGEGQQLLFVLRTESRYTKPMSGVVKNKTEERFYFDNNNLIRWLDAKKKPVAPTPEAEQRGRELLAQAGKYLDLLNSAKK